jgi:hypothetical protein
MFTDGRKLPAANQKEKKMHIQVTDVLFDAETQQVVVEFSTPFGVGVGEWRDVAPERYSHHHVEIETANRLTWGKEIVPVADEHSILDYDADRLMTLQGKLESVEPDGVAYLLVGAVVVTVKTNGEPPALDTFVRAHTNKIILFPYD